ncbi:MAG: imidazolonepropionase [Spirochaetaceae bacterium]|nr:imidazolonepropionase [Spirochaetaceae bacterium]
MTGNLIVANIGELATPRGFAANTGIQMSHLDRIKAAGIAIEDGQIVYCGTEAESEFQARLKLAKVAGTQVLDAKAKACVPGFIDCHTHFIYAGSREDEFFWRARGLPYMEIHKRGGGILRTVESTRNASSDELFSLGKTRLASMLAQGITTVEAKSGYGLDLDTEVKQLETIDALRFATPIDIVPTYLGPHAIPPEFAEDSDRYIDFIIQDVLPFIKARKLAAFADIFCEKGIFDIGQSRHYLQAAERLGFGLKIHADEIEHMGGAGLAAELGAISADHLLKASQEDLAAMGQAGVVAVCLPLTAFTLREPYAPARAMIDSGLAVALASDFNPGSCYSQSIPLIFALAVLYMGLSLEEALTALTLNGAASLGLADSTGSLEKGKAGDLLLLDAPSCDYLAYNVGMNLVSTVVKNGVIVREN